MLEKLSPGDVFHWFELLSAIPHGSGDTKAISDWCAAFAADRKLTYRQDDAGNIVIYKHGSRGAEYEPSLILVAATERLHAPSLPVTLYSK